MKQRVIIALGGNAILNKGGKGAYEDQMKNVNSTTENILNAIADRDYEIVFTHGNGPQVGNLLIQNASASAVIPEMPMFVCTAMTQGQLGYFIQQSLKNLFLKRGQKGEVATIITQVVVDQGDPAFQHPSKPVGPFYSKAEADKIISETGFVFKEDAGRGYRRVVPSPEPLYITEIEVVKELLRQGIIPVVSGGGGIPVIYNNGAYQGIDAVIDKDKAGAVLADMLEADLLIILTAVEKVSLNFGTPQEIKIDTMTLDEAKKYLLEGHFAEGSMKPKIEAMIKFIEKNPKRRALITHQSVLKEALAEKNGTWIKY